MKHNGNLPDWCTDQMIDDHFGPKAEDCERCEGDGHILCFVCKGKACDICDEEGTVQCPDCEGEGLEKD